MAVVLRHNRHFIYFILFLMANLSPPFIPALMTQAFKEGVPLQSKHKLLIFQNILSVSLPPSFSSFKHPYPFYSDQTLMLWRRWKAQALLAVKGKGPFTILLSNKRQTRRLYTLNRTTQMRKRHDVTQTVSAPLWLTLGMMSILLSPRFLVTMCYRRRAVCGLPSAGETSILLGPWCLPPSTI